MDTRDTLARLLTALHEAALDDALWPRAAALIDEACGLVGNGLIVGEGFEEAVKVFFAGFYRRGERRQDMEHEYFTVYHRFDERLPRLRLLPDSQVVHVTDLFTSQELKTSAAYNDWLRRAGAQDSLMVRLDGPDGLRIVWTLGNPAGPEGRSSDHVTMIERLLPHIRQFVRVRQAMVDAQALGTSFSALLDNTRTGIVQLDWRGRIVEINDRALDILRRRDGLFDQNGRLSAWLPGDNAQTPETSGCGHSSLRPPRGRPVDDRRALCPTAETGAAHTPCWQRAAAHRRPSRRGAGHGGRAGEAAAARCQAGIGGSGPDSGGEPGGGHVV